MHGREWLMPAQAPETKRTVLRDLIDERGLKYGFVASKLEISPTLFTRLLSGERPLSARELLALTELLGVEAKSFFDGRELLPSRQTQEGVGADDAGGGAHLGTPPALGATA